MGSKEITHLAAYSSTVFQPPRGDDNDSTGRQQAAVIQLLQNLQSITASWSRAAQVEGHDACIFRHATQVLS
jgi:hypothetical protein